MTKERWMAIKASVKERKRRLAFEAVVEGVEGGLPLCSALIGNLSNSTFHRRLKRYPDLFDRYRATSRVLIMPERDYTIYCSNCAEPVSGKPIKVEAEVDGVLDLMRFCGDACWRECSPETYRKTNEGETPTLR